MTRRALPLFAFVAVAAAAAVVAHRGPDLSLGGPQLAIEAAAAALAVTAVVLGWCPSRGPLLVAAAAAWLAVELYTPAAGVLFTAGLLVYAGWPVLLAAAGGAGPRLVLIGAVIGPGLLGVAAALASDPRDHGCGACPPNLVSIADAPGLALALTRVGLALAIVWAAACCAAVPLRRADPILMAGVALFGVDAAHGVSRGFLSTDPTDRALRLAEAAVFVVAFADMARARLWLRRTRARVARLVLDIGAAPRPGELQARLATTLGDPSLRLLYAVQGEWIDEVGDQAHVPDGATRVQAAGADLLVVVHRPGLLDDPQLVDELATTARLAVEHERLQAARRARLAELRASRERIVAAADRERRSLERDLHDGAQQRLVTLGLSLRLARRRGDDPALAAAEEHVRAAVVALRDVAHGLFPTVLADDGLSAAIDVLSEQTPRLVSRRLPDRRFPDAVESAAYFAASEALRLTEREVTVDGVAENGCLHLVIAAEGTLNDAMTQIRDRVGAAGGTVISRRGELVLEMPCGS